MLIRMLMLFPLIMFISIFTVGVAGAKIDLSHAVGVWLFDDGAGDTAIDSSGNDNHGKFMGKPKWVDGKFGKALEFDGASTILDCGNGQSLDFVGKENLSVSAWAKSNINNISQGMILWKALGCSTWAQYGFGVGSIEAVGSPPNKLTFYYRTVNNDTKQIVTDKNDFPPNEWVHVAGTYDGNELKLYMNGSLGATQKVTGVPWASTEHVYIGGDPGCGIRYVWSGALDEVMIFDITLTEDDVKSLMRGYAGAKAVFGEDKLATTWADIKSR